MKISIAMAIYNGAKYLQEQLDSFAAQTLLPDELIVCDDGSTDRSVEIIETFSRTVAFSVQVYRNETRLGYAANFDRAMALCKGDIVFLSDQDDYWFANKIEAVYAIFESRSDVWVVVNDAEITDESLDPTGLTILGQIHSAGLNADHLISGCCSAYRNTILPALLPVPAATHSHDGWLHLFGLSLTCREITTQCLQYYRRHGDNTSGYITSSTLPASAFKLFRNSLAAKNLQQNPVQACEKRLLQLVVFRERLEANAMFLLSNLPVPSALTKTLSHIDILVRANETRKAILLKRWPARLVAALHFYWTGGYQHFEGIKSCAKDVLR
jgi:hypothetical protein